MESTSILRALMFAVWCAIVVIVYVLESKKLNDHINRLLEQRMFDQLEKLYNKNRYTVILCGVAIVIGYIIINW